MLMIVFTFYYHNYTTVPFHCLCLDFLFESISFNLSPGFPGMTFPSYYGHSDRSSLDTGYHECGWASIRIMLLAGASAGRNIRLYFVQVRHLFRSEQEKKEKREELYVGRLPFRA